MLFESVAQSQLWLFKEDGSFEVVTGPRTTEGLKLFDSVRRKRDAWYLFDLCGEDPTEPIAIAPFTIVTASPNPKHYKQLYNRTGNKYCVPCWSWEELQKYRAYAANTISPGKISIFFPPALCHDRLVLSNVNLFWQVLPKKKPTQTSKFSVGSQVMFIG